MQYHNQKNMSWYVYIVKCSDESLYTGISTNVTRRIQEHNYSIGAKSLRGKLPVELQYKELYGTKSEAAKREKEIKGWNRIKKLRLVSGFFY